MSHAMGQNKGYILVRYLERTFCCCLLPSPAYTYWTCLCSHEAWMPFRPSKSSRPAIRGRLSALERNVSLCCRWTTPSWC